MLANRIRLGVIGTLLVASVLFVSGLFAETLVPTVDTQVCVTLQGSRSGTSEEPVSWEAIDGGSTIASGDTSAAISSETVGCFPISGFAHGPSYDLYIKGEDHLGVLITAAELGGPLPTSGIVDVSATVTLLDGDANNDNSITTADLSILGSALNTFPPLSASVEPRADFNEDGVISTADLSILGSNLNTFPPISGDADPTP